MSSHISIFFSVEKKTIISGDAENYQAGKNGLMLELFSFKFNKKFQFEWKFCVKTPMPKITDGNKSE